MSLLVFFFKMTICSGILYGYYWCFLHNKRFHQYNRFYLLVVLLLSAIIPFVNIPFTIQQDDSSRQAMWQIMQVLPGQLHEPYSTTEAVAAGGYNWLNWKNGLYLAYAAGIVVLLIGFLRSLLYIRRLKKQYPAEHVQEITLYQTREKGTPFAFWRSIFWHEDIAFNSKDGQQMFRHELYHVWQQHSFDIILAELITAIGWFNPFFYFVRREIRAIHEFLADQYAISGSDRYAYAEMLVLQTIQERRPGLQHHFFHNQIKRRIAMITQAQKNRYSYWSRVMILPVATLLVVLLAFTVQRATPAGNSSTASVSPLALPVTIIVDAGHGGIDPGAQAADGSIKEKDIALALAQQVKALAGEYNLKVVLTRDKDELAGTPNDKNNSLRYRTRLAEEEKASLLLSLHVAAQDNGSSQSGCEIFVTKRNEATMPGSFQLAHSLQQQMSDLFQNKPVVKQRQEQGIWVLDKAPCPAALIECGFLSNPADAAFITQQDNQQKIARRILEGVTAYLQADKQTSILIDTVPQKEAVAAEEVERYQQQLEAARQKLAEQAPLNEKIQQHKQEMEASLREAREQMLIAQKQLREQALAQQGFTKDLHAQQEALLQEKAALLAQLKARVDKKALEQEDLTRYNILQELLAKQKEALTQETIRQKELAAAAFKARKDAVARQEQLLAEQFKTLADNNAVQAEALERLNALQKAMKEDLLRKKLESETLLRQLHEQQKQLELERKQQGNQEEQPLPDDTTR